MLLFMSVAHALIFLECIARTGKIQLKKNDISKKIGELFVNRFYVNMNSDMLDTPGNSKLIFSNIYMYILYCEKKYSYFMSVQKYFGTMRILLKHMNILENI